MTTTTNGRQPRARKRKRCVTHASRYGFCPRTLADVPSTLTTGQVGILLGCSPKTVADLFDAGKLSGYRLPTRQALDRRITRRSLLAFARTNGIDLGLAGGLGRAEVLLVGLEPVLRERLLGLPEVAQGRLGFTMTDCPFRAGEVLACVLPVCIVADSHGVGSPALRSLAALLADGRPAPAPALVLLLAEDGGSEGLPTGSTLARPVGADEVANRVRVACGLAVESEVA